MSNDIALRADQHLDIPTGTEPATVALARWAHAADAAYAIALKLCATSFAPKAYRGKPEEGCAAILAGAELGFSPTASLRAFDDIQGVPAPKAITLRAVVQGKGHEIKVLESTPDIAVVSGRRKGDTDWQTSTWTIERAQQMQLTGKPEWKKQPGAMLIARATSEVCRWVGADAIMGMPYSAEEIRDHGGPVVEGRPSPRIVTTAEILGEQPEADEPATLPPIDHDDDPVEGEQLARMAALFRAKGITDPDEGLAFVSDITGRPVASTKELTFGEARRVIAQLQQLGDEQPTQAG